LPGYSAVAVSALGKKGLGYNEQEDINDALEAIRTAASGREKIINSADEIKNNLFNAAGCRSLQDVEVTKMSVDTLGHAEAAAEGAILGTWKYQGPKSKKPKALPSIEPFPDKVDGWKSGVIKADAQNFARRLMDTPGNLMTPTIFAQVYFGFNFFHFLQ